MSMSLVALIGLKKLVDFSPGAIRLLFVLHTVANILMIIL